MSTKAKGLLDFFYKKDEKWTREKYAYNQKLNGEIKENVNEDLEILHTNGKPQKKRKLDDCLQEQDQSNTAKKIRKLKRKKVCNNGEDKQKEDAEVKESEKCQDLSKSCLNESTDCRNRCEGREGSKECLHIVQNDSNIVDPNRQNIVLKGKAQNQEKDTKREKSLRKKKKLKKLKKETTEGTCKPLNLSDICNNLADVSIISDDGSQTHQFSNCIGNDKEINDKETFITSSHLQRECPSQNEGKINPVNLDKCDVSSDILSDKNGVQEISYEAFLGGQCINESVDSVKSTSEENKIKNGTLKKRLDQMENTEHDLIDIDRCSTEIEDKSIKRTKKEKSKKCLQQSEHFETGIEKGRRLRLKTCGSKPHFKNQEHTKTTQSMEKKACTEHTQQENQSDCKNVTEVSYIDYLTSLSEDEQMNAETDELTAGLTDQNKKDSSGSDRKMDAKEKERDKSTVETDIVKEESGEGEIPMPKKYPSITNFFSKVSRHSKMNFKDSSKDDSGKLTVQALIHVPSTEKGSLVGKVEKGQNCQANQSRKKSFELDDEIQVLSSEIIEISDDKSSKTDVSHDVGTDSPQVIESCGGIEDSELACTKDAKKSFLHSTSHNMELQKATQSVLNITKSGLKHVKMKAKSKGRKGTKKGTDKTDETCEDEQRNKKSVKEMPEKEENKNLCEEKSIHERRQSLRQKYRVKLLNNSGIGTPIKMKFTRCSKDGSESSQDDLCVSKLKVKGKTKQNKAKKLLEKAKMSKEVLKKKDRKIKEKKRGEIKNTTSVSENEGKDKTTRERKNATSVSEKQETTKRRCSSRLSDKRKSLKEIEIVNVDDDEDSEDSSFTQTKKTSSKKKSNPPTNQKVPKNLAPIFLKKATKSVIESPVKKVLDPEAEKLRHAFLMSGIPSVVKDNLSAPASVVMATYPPVPEINHIQQKSNSEIWHLPNAILKLMPVDSCLMWNIPKWKFCVTLSKEKAMDTRRSENEKLSENMVSHLLKEISQVCPSFPTQRMYNVLKEKQEEENADQQNEKPSHSENVSKEDKPEKDKLRRSLRRRRKEVIEIADIRVNPQSNSQDNAEEKEDSVNAVLSLPEKYQPFHSTEIIGNSANIKKLKSWLVEWKHCLDKEAKKARLLMMKEKKKNRQSKDEEEEEWWTDDASDFDIDSDSDTENQLCNTAMLTGPSGIGKTATVYALAQELGFKVFEVNASSCRNGKRILTYLQEATQSQQVSKHDFCGTPKKNNQQTGSKFKVKDKSSLTNQKPTSFTNLFKKVDAMDREKNLKNTEEKSKKENKKKRKRDLEEENFQEGKKRKKINSEEMLKTENDAKAMNLSSTSIILFEEVDVVFEQHDKGFWSAIQNFMSTTKIPIILTSNDMALASKFDGKFEHYRFKLPPLVSSAVYLRLIALVEGIRTDWDEMYKMISIYNGDIRRAMLTLEYWLHSGGGAKIKRSITDSSIDVPTKSDKVPAIPERSHESLRKQLISTLEKSQASEDDDFVSIKPIARKKNQIVSDDESSNIQPIELCKSMDRIICDAVSSPPVHLSTLESVLGIQATTSIKELLQQIIQGSPDQTTTLVTEAYNQYLQLQVSLLYTHHIDMLPLPRIVIQKLGQVTPFQARETKKKPKRKRIKFTLDIYDSEGSDGDNALENVKHNMPSQPSTAEEKPLTQSIEHNKREIMLSLSEFSRFYDDMSYTDTLQTLDKTIADKEKSMCGLIDELPKHELSDWWRSEQKNQICSELELRSCKRLYNKLTNVMRNISDDNVFSVPIVKDSFNSLKRENATCNESMTASIRKAQKNAVSSLPLTNQCQQSSVMFDYLPYLRSIIKSEQVREASKIKRRFHHYFDQIGLQLKDQTLEVLLSSFT